MTPYKVLEGKNGEFLYYLSMLQNPKAIRKRTDKFRLCKYKKLGNVIMFKATLFVNSSGLKTTERPINW